uniref:Uncharacterized protein n=1 Tax=Romanomermis culicivorax TaxID=13658 RepID=A0A915KH27_ROMCU
MKKFVLLLDEQIYPKHYRQASPSMLGKRARTRKKCSPQNFHTYPRLKHAELYKNHTKDYGYLK